ncbi:hypothetical protein [Erwinia phage vB_Ea277G]|nr:hypothetical protein [Erwinia phage vB_Ea277G]
MSVITKLIADVKAEIPRQVLEIAFLGDMGRENRFASNLDFQIRQKVIDARVWVDLSLQGAEEVNIPLARCEVEQDDQYKTIIRIPKELTGGRIITQVLAFNYTINGVTGMTNNGYNNNSFNMSNEGNSPQMNSAAKILRSASPAPILGSAATRIVGENVILLNDYMGSVKQGNMTVRVGHDPELNTFKPTSIKQLSKFVVYAVKAYIYTNSVITLDMGHLYGGSEIGRIRDIIDGYADCNELYNTYYDEEMIAVNFMNDDTRHGNFLRTLIGGAAS